jgi:hypothetical protein
LEEKVPAPVKKIEIKAAGIRRAVHATPLNPRMEDIIVLKIQGLKVLHYRSG